MFLVNGLPLVIGEAKTPTRSAVTWFDGAFQINQIYEREVPAMFVPNVFSFATEGRCYRYGSIRMPIDMWGPWRDEDNQDEGELHHVQATVQSMLRPDVVLDIAQNFTLFATDKKHRRIKIICRYQQFETANKMVARVVAGYPKKGLIWHFQGSGKSLLMIFAAQKLRLHPQLGNPTVIIVVDRIDLDTQITATFNAADVPNMLGVDSREELHTLLAQDVRKVLITTIHKFGDVEAASSRLVSHPEEDKRQDATSTAFFDALEPLDIYEGNLPHWRQEGKLYFVTFRQADFLPQAKLDLWHREREDWLKRNPRPWRDSQWQEYHRLFSARINHWLDAGYGSCVLRRPDCRKIVEDAVRFFEGQRYHVDELVVAANHVHVLVQPLPGYKLEDILHSWKSFTANKINKLLGRSGTFWQKESYDHLVRNDAARERMRQYMRRHEVEAASSRLNTGAEELRQDAGATPLNERSNVIVMVDEAHRTQEGDLGRKMRDALPNAFLFGLTGTPINRADRNTFWAFGADEDERGYLSRYSFQDSIRDRATLPLHFEAPEVRLKIDRAAIDEAYKQITGNLSEQDRDDLAKRAAKMAVLVKNPERVRAVVEHIVQHFQTKIEPNGFKAQVVVFDRECCVLYKQVMDELIGPEASAIVMTAAPGDPAEWKQHSRDRDEEEKLLDRFRDPADPLKFVIVTSKLLTGFDAPILQVMYLDKPMKDHNLLQAICRTNRTYGQEKTHGLIVDYIGIFDDVARALDFDEKAVQQVVSNIDELRRELPLQVQKCLALFPHVDRTVGGYEGLMAAQQCLPNNQVRDQFAAEYSVLARIWEVLSPDTCLSPYETDFRWLTQVYESVKPPSGNGRLLWHALGAKTVQLINENVHVESVRDDLETLVLDSQVLEQILKDANAADADRRGREVEIKLIARLRRHAGNPKFVALGERLERVKERHEQGFLTSLEFLKEILELARDVLEAERTADPVEQRDKAKEALTELFNEAKSKDTHIMVERIVADIDEIVKKVRFPDWQRTTQGERLVQKSLRDVLYLKYKIKDQDLFDKAYAYIRQYY